MRSNRTAWKKEVKGKNKQTKWVQWWVCCSTAFSSAHTLSKALGNRDGKIKIMAFQELEKVGEAFKWVMMVQSAVYQVLTIVRPRRGGRTEGIGLLTEEGTINLETIRFSRSVGKGRKQVIYY